MAPLKVVANTSPLIYLSVLNRFALLQDLFGEVYLPEAAYREVVIEGTGQPGAEETRIAIREGWLRQVTAQDRIAVESLLDELHLGEVEAIVLARELNVGRILLDDRAARNKARLMGLAVTGTIGVLLLARESGMRIDLRHDLDLLIQQNFRLSRDLYDRLVSDPL